MHLCHKLCYASYTDAERVAKRMRRNCDDQIQAFRCERCHRFHVGHTAEEISHNLRQFKQRRRALDEAESDEFALAS